MREGNVGDRGAASSRKRYLADRGSSDLPGRPLGAPCSPRETTAAPDLHAKLISTYFSQFDNGILVFLKL